VILRKEGCIRPERKRARPGEFSDGLSLQDAPNAVWSAVTAQRHREAAEFGPCEVTDQRHREAAEFGSCEPERGLVACAGFRASSA